MDNQRQIIEKTVKNMLEKLCVDFEEIQFIENSGFKNGIKFLIKTNDSGILIGTEGATIYAINHLVKKIIWKTINKTNGKKINFFIDINDYQGKNIEKIKTKAVNLARKVDLFKRNIEMETMSAYERMIVHSTLADNPKVRTESVGEGDLRRVVIKTKS